jgi:tetratricopeptide (TPR) repeat protein
LDHFQVYSAHSICWFAVILLIGIAATQTQAQTVNPELAQPEQLFQDAVAAQQRGDDVGAERNYRELLRLRPDAVALVEKVAEKTANANDYLLAGQTRFGMSQYDLARRDADAARQLNPKLAGLATLNGMILEQTADYDGAEAALLQALSADPDDYNAHFYLGANFYFKRDMKKARLHLTRALQLQPDSAQARYELALVAHAEGNLNEALKELEIVVHEIPDWLQPHVELSALYYRLHRPDDGARERHVVDRMMAALQQSQSQAAR